MLINYLDGCELDFVPKRDLRAGRPWRGSLLQAWLKRPFVIEVGHTRASKTFTPIVQQASASGLGEGFAELFGGLSRLEGN